MFKVIVSGITKIEDAKVALSAGADGIAFQFNPKDPRFIQMRVVKAMVDELSSEYTFIPYALFVDEKDFVVDKVMLDSKCNSMIFEGSEDGHISSKYSGKFLKKINLSNEDNLNFLNYYDCDEFVLDVKFLYDLPKAAKAAQVSDVYLGGLVFEENIEILADKIAPAGFFLGENVESAPGVMDQIKLVRTIRLIKNLDEPQRIFGLMQ